MKTRLSSIDQAPRSLPIWQTIMEDLGNPPTARVARVLGVGERTIYRYAATGRAPRSVLLALFWLTTWGRSAVNVQAENGAQVALGLVGALQRRIAELERKLKQLQRLGGYGSANDPIREPLDSVRCLPGPRPSAGGTVSIETDRKSVYPSETK